MAFLSYEVIPSGAVVDTVASLVVPANATHVMLQATGNDIRYTMDGVLAYPTTTSGMVLIDGQPPEQFLIEDLLNIRFIQDIAGVGSLHQHYFAGRNI